MDEEFYPVRKRLVGNSKSEKDAVILVDIGGGLGHDLAEFRTKHIDTDSDIRGRLILQDKPDVIAQVAPETSRGLEVSVHDFFTEQPIRGKSSSSFFMSFSIAYLDSD